MTYDREDMVSFGRYLLSDRRRALLLQTMSDVPLYDRAREVYDADLANWESERPVKEGPEVEGAEV